MPKSNPDYSNSCKNLTNAQTTQIALLTWRERLAALADVEAAIEESVPADLRSLRDECTKALDAARESLKAFIDADGSYQDTLAGHYAIKQSKNATIYHPDQCRTAIPQFAAAVIEETVNPDKIKGLLKGGLITEADVEKFSTKEPLSPAYIIK
jgi:hypothetical protein